MTSVRNEMKTLASRCHFHFQTRRKKRGKGVSRDAFAKPVCKNGRSPNEPPARKRKEGRKREAGEEAREGLTRQALSQWH